MEEKEKKVVISYIVTHYSDGSTEVTPSDPTINVEDCYEDIEYTAKLLEERRESNRVYTATQQAIGDFFKAMHAAKENQQE